MRQRQIANHQVPASFATAIDLRSQLSVTKEWLQEVIDGYKSSDDAFREAFLRGVIFTGAVEGHVKITRGARKLLRSLGNEWIHIIDIENVEATPKPGPYIASKQWLFEVWKLYDDVQGAFLASLIVDSKR